MADTVRTSSALVDLSTGLFKSQTQQEISPQDLRDFCISRYGGRYIRSVSADTTAINGDEVIAVDASGAARTVTLPHVTPSKHMSIVVIKDDSSVNTVTIAPVGGTTINGATDYDLFLQYDSIRIVSTGGEWLIIEKNLTPHSARMIRTTTQSVAHNTGVNVAHNVETYAYGCTTSNLNTTSARINIKRAGFYKCTSRHSFTNGGINDWSWNQIRRDGAAAEIHSYGLVYESQTGFNPRWSSSALIQLEVDDYVFESIKHFFGSNKNTIAGASAPSVAVQEIL